MEEKLIPVLQMDDLGAIEAAREHLEENGYRADVRLLSDLPESELQDWMTPENGDYMFYIEESKFETAMNMLGDFFGYTPDEE